MAARCAEWGGEHVLSRARDLAGDVLCDPETRCGRWAGGGVGAAIETPESQPIVSPTVSAATGALLLPYVPAGQPRLTLLLACYAMFGLSLVASLIVITLIGSRLAPSCSVPLAWSPPCGRSRDHHHRKDRARAPPVLAHLWSFTFHGSVIRGTLFVAPKAIA